MGEGRGSSAVDARGRVCLNAATDAANTSARPRIADRRVRFSNAVFVSTFVSDVFRLVGRSRS
jgi:hypothetical protein